MNTSLLGRIHTVVPIAIRSQPDPSLLKYSLSTVCWQVLCRAEESGGGFIRRVGEAGGGQYAVCARRAAAQLLLALLDHTVTERLGSHAARIFRYYLCYSLYSFGSAEILH